MRMQNEARRSPKATETFHLLLEWAVLILFLAKGKRARMVSGSSALGNEREVLVHEDHDVTVGKRDEVIYDLLLFSSSSCLMYSPTTCGFPKWKWDALKTRKVLQMVKSQPIQVRISHG